MTPDIGGASFNALRDEIFAYGIAVRGGPCNLSLSGTSDRGLIGQRPTRPTQTDARITNPRSGRSPDVSNTLLTGEAGQRALDHLVMDRTHLIRCSGG